MNTNFNELIKMASQNLEDERLYHIGIYILEIEDSLWDGRPHIYSNMRVLIEAIMDFIIEEDFNLEVDEDEGADYKTKEEIWDWINAIGRKEIIWATLEKPILCVQTGCFDLAKKIKLVQNVYSQIGIDITRWNLQSFRKQLNTSSHKIAMPRDLKKAFEERFNNMKIFHDVVYTEFLKIYYENDEYTIKVDDYYYPDDGEMETIVNKCRDRLNKYVNSYR